MATRKKARSAAQRAATRKLVALNRSRRKTRAAKFPKPAAAAPARRRRARRASPAATPARRRRWRQSSHKAASAAGRVLRYRRTNPAGGEIGRFISQTLMPSAIGGAGALTLDVLLGVLPIPANLKTGPMAPIVKVAGAVGLGLIASQFVHRRTAEQIAAGALTVTMYNVAKQALVRMSGGRIPGLSDVEMYPDGVGAYISGEEVPALGYTDSGMQVGVGDMEVMEGYETGVYR